MKRMAMFILILLYGLHLGFSDTDGNDNPKMAAVHSMPENALWVANGAEDSLSVIDINSQRVFKILPAGVNPHILSASPDNKYVYVVNAGNHDREPGAHGTPNEKTSSSHSATDKDMASEHNGDAVSADTKNRENSLWVYDTITGLVMQRISVGMGPTHAVPSADGRWVYVTNTDGNSLSIINTLTWNVDYTINSLAEPHDGALSADGRYLYVATSGDSSVTVVDTQKRSIIRTEKTGMKPRGIVVGENGDSKVYVTNKGAGELAVLRGPLQEGILATLKVGDGAHALRTSPDGNTIYIALSKENAVAVVDAKQLAVRATISVGELPEQIDLSDDGQLLFISNNGDSTVSILSTETSKVIATIPVGDGAYGVQQIRRTVGRFANLDKSERGYARINAEMLNDALSEKDFMLINVHIPYSGDIEGTDLDIPYNQIDRYLAKLPSKDSTIIVYCRSGSMSRYASDKLVELGYTNVVELVGGFNAWSRAGYTLMTK